MSLGYVFWCRNCARDHAGECPPAKNPCAEVTDKYFVPEVGSRWVVQRRLSDMVWHLPGEKDPQVYVVVRTAGRDAWIRAVDEPTGIEWEYGAERWSAEGSWRFAPAP